MSCKEVDPIQNVISLWVNIMSKANDEALIADSPVLNLKKKSRDAFNSAAKQKPNTTGKKRTLKIERNRISAGRSARNCILLRCM